MLALQRRSRCRDPAGFVLEAHTNSLKFEPTVPFQTPVVMTQDSIPLFFGDPGSLQSGMVQGRYVS
jgi:hypothetical protein